MIKVFAPAKVNLTLHVTGQREDGYHLLDSLVAFPRIGDELSFEAADTTTLKIESMGQDLPAGEDNLVMRAARLFLPNTPCAITLRKDLPVAAGIGGGSADAGAVFRAATMIEPDVPLSAADVIALGADVPACLASLPQRMGGIGDVIAPVQLWPGDGILVLVNPGVPVPTPVVFRRLTSRSNPPMPEILPSFATLDTLAGFVSECRNDLEQPAIEEAPIIANVLSQLRSDPDCMVARMSGSGATCFGLYRDPEAAVAMTDRLKIENPGWWAASAPFSTPQDIVPKGQFIRATT
ncbi:MAG: 4-(cytidine 5'-diphospho)-2-C-methyl-D-erythritol kinase [Litoreibacter sp.]|nr:4-(cytidine 5'-diphospho)-2-C-methyl-D-erythritol kinase [Litoreibacter sp.]